MCQQSELFVALVFIFPNSLCPCELRCRWHQNCSQKSSDEELNFLSHLLFSFQFEETVLGTDDLFPRLDLLVWFSSRENCIFFFPFSNNRVKVDKLIKANSRY